MYDNIEDGSKDAGFLRLVAGGWVPSSELPKIYRHLISNSPASAMAGNLDHAARQEKVHVHTSDSTNI